MDDEGNIIVADSRNHRIQVGLERESCWLISTLIPNRFSPHRESLWRSLEPMVQDPESWTDPVGSPWPQTDSSPWSTSATRESLYSKRFDISCVFLQPFNQINFQMCLTRLVRSNLKKNVYYLTPYQGTERLEIIEVMLISRLSLKSTPKLCLDDYSDILILQNVASGLPYFAPNTRFLFT